jgi:HEAT repeat protein
MIKDQLVERNKMDTLELSDLIKKLRDKDLHVRDQARYLLVDAGKDAVQPLTEMLKSPNTHDRWEAVKLLGKIRDKATADVLVEALTDESMSVHWAASEALIGLGSGAILPLLEGLERHFDSARFRQGAYHILRMFEHMGHLDSHVQEVLDALRDIEPFSTVPWAAERAIQALTIH